MYHEKYYKQGAANVACIATDTQDDVYGNMLMMRRMVTWMVMMREC